MKEKVEEIDNQINNLKKKNNIKNIIIIVLSIILVIGAILNIPKVRKSINNYSKQQKLESTYNSKYKLNLESVYGDTEAYHPKILSFDNQWNGYYYWMSYTPYPDSDEQKENPHIVASNDLVNWVTPDGLENPLDDIEGNDSRKYNSDSHLTMNTDLNRLECYWRMVDDEINRVTIYRRYTTDGVNWSDKEAITISNDRHKKDYISPAIIYEDGIYKIWYVDHDYTVRYAEAKDNEQWKDIKELNLYYPRKLQSWHLDVVKTDKGYEMLIMAFKNWDKRGVASLYHTESKDNKKWSKCTEIIKPTSKTKNWDNRGMYRSSMIKKDGIYYVFYSASDKENIKGIGIMYGKDINKLHKVNIDYKNDIDAAKKFEKLIKKEKNR